MSRNTNAVWLTPTAENAERSFGYGLDTLCQLQDAIDDYESDRIPVPDSLIAEYQSTASAVMAFGMEWGFDVTDVEGALERFH